MFSHFFSKPKNKPLKISAYSIWKCWKYFMNVDSRSVRLKQPYAQSHTFVGEWKKGGKYMYMGFNIIKICNMLKLKINILIYKCIYLYLKKIRKILKTVNFS